MISFVFFEQKMNVKHFFTKEVISNTQMGFDYLKKNTVSYTIPTTIQFFENQKGVTSITKKHWGIFDIAIVSSKIQNESFQKIGLLANQNFKKEALYLSDNNTSLVVVGNTKITGNVSLPKQGVKSGNIAGVSYYGSELVYGATKTSSTTLPKITNSLFLRNFYKNYAEGVYQNFELEEDISTHQSFSKNTLLFEDYSTITLQNNRLSGNILIVSKTAIKVLSSSILEDIILLAPEIIVGAGVKGNFQAIASKKIVVQANCLLNYPSAFILLPENVQEAQNNSSSYSNPADIIQMVFEENTQVKGMLVFDSENKKTNYHPQIKIGTNTQITGEIYCSKNLELLGSVFGSVYTNNFITKQSGFNLYKSYIQWCYQCK